MLKNMMLAAAALAFAGTLSLTASAPAQAGMFCSKGAHGYVAKKPRFDKFCDKRTARAHKRGGRKAHKKR